MSAYDVEKTVNAAEILVRSVLLSNIPDVPRSSPPFSTDKAIGSSRLRLRLYL